MRPLSAPELLDVWERAAPYRPARRALMLLEAAYPDTARDALATLSAGERDAQLLTLRGLQFGPQLTGLARCPACGERVELEVDGTRFGRGTDDPGPLAMTVGGVDVRVRLPNAADLAAISTEPDVSSARTALLLRCVESVARDGTPVGPDRLPEDVVTAIAARLADADSRADVELSPACPRCTHRWTVVFDVCSFFWREIDAWARRTLNDVHLLASRYGWGEADILRMSPWRRGFYLERSIG